MKEAFFGKVEWFMNVAGMEITLCVGKVLRKWQEIKGHLFSLTSFVKQEWNEVLETSRF